jgi:thioester reductase-like protein
MATVLFTGFPGFLGSELLPRVLARDPGLRACCLVQRKFAALARRRAEELAASSAGLAGRVELAQGDITVPGLGLPAGALDDVVEIFHLAALYDLSVPRLPAFRVNVDGTRNVLDAAAACARLERFQYVSTCYVSGRRVGSVTERDLLHTAGFHNHYEETKHEAERLVQERMRGGLPATIYRPSVVVGDSTTGATQKYDGPYTVIRWLLKQPRVAVMPVVGDTRAHALNLVPRDFVVAAIAHLSAAPASRGKVYQLADPAPPSIDRLLDLLADATERRVIRIPLPLVVAKAAIDRVPGVYRVMGIPSAAVDYFVHPARYDTTQARADLAGSGIAVPPLESYVQRLVDFVRAHPDLPAVAMA